MHIRFYGRDEGEGTARFTFADSVFFILLLMLALTLVASGYRPAAAAPSAKPRLVEIGTDKASASITVAIGKSENVRTDAAFSDLVVSDPETADILPLTDRTLSILGKKIGSTRVSVYAEGKRLVGVFDVEVSYDTSMLAAELNRQFPHASFKVSSVNGRIMLSGTAPDGVTLDRAVTMAKQFGPDVINAVKVAQPQQVLLEVRFVEVSRSAGRELGIRWEALGDDFSAIIGTAGGLGTTSSFGVIIGRLLSKGVDTDVIIRSLEERGLARRLAEPNLVALSGDTASFLAGGEFPFPVQSTQNTITVEFKKFGVGLAFTPTVLSSGIINLKIEPEVSQLDPTSLLRIGGVEIPSLIVRRANTTIELRDGQTFAIAGLLQSVNSVDTQQLPWIGNIPILGALFRSAAYQKKETDLVIVVTPRIVRPLRPGDVVKTPLDNTVPPNDVDFFLHGVSELTPDMLRKARALQAGHVPLARPNTGHIIDLPTETVHVVQK